MMDNLKISPDRKEELKSLIIDRMQIKSDLDMMQSRSKEVLAQLDKKISNAMFINGVDSVTFFADRGVAFSLKPKKISVKKVTPKAISWDVDELQKKLSKEAFESITIRHYEIIKLDKLIGLMKAAGVNPKEFKDCIKATKTVNNDLVDHAVELGIVSRKELTGCYTLIEKSSYLRFTINSAEGDKD